MENGAGGGHFCNKAEKNYSPIEGKTTAVARGLQDTKYYKDRAIITATLRPHVLETIQTAQQGVSGMISRIEETVFWPGISTDVIKTRVAV